MLFFPYFVVVFLLLKTTHAHSTLRCPCSEKEVAQFEDKDLMNIPDNIAPETKCLNIIANMIEEIPDKTFYDHNLKLVCVKFTHNFLNKIHRKALFGLTNLTTLDLSSNNLRYLHQKTFLWTQKLTFLNLSYNSFDKFPHLYVPNLDILDLDHNYIEEVTSQDIAGIPKLTMLSLRNNKLKVFSRSVLHNLKSLKFLFLQDNHLLPCERWMVKFMTRETRGSNVECHVGHVASRKVCIGLDHCVATPTTSHSSRQTQSTSELALHDIAMTTTKRLFQEVKSNVVGVSSAIVIPTVSTNQIEVNGNGYSRSTVGLLLMLVGVVTILVISLVVALVFVKRRYPRNQPAYFDDEDDAL